MRRGKIDPSPRANDETGGSVRAPPVLGPVPGLCTSRKKKEVF